MPIKKGTRVKVYNDYPFCHALRGKTGTIVIVNGDGSCGVVFDEEFQGGHSLGGLCARRRGRWMITKYLEPLFQLNNEDYSIFK